MELQIVANRIDVSQVRLIDNDGSEMMRSEPMSANEAARLANRISTATSIPTRHVHEGPTT